MKKSLYSRIIPIGSNFIVKRKGHWGIVDAKDNILLPIEYTRVHWFDGDYAGIQMNNKWGLVNSDGVVTTEPQYDAIKYYSQYNGCEVEIEGIHFVIDVNNNILLSIEDGNVFFEETKLLVCSHGKRQLFNYDGSPFSNIHSSIDYQHGRFYCEDYEEDRTTKYIIKADGTEIRLPDFNFDIFHEVMTPFSHEGKYGIINEDGNIVVPNKYSYIVLESGIIAINQNDSKDNTYNFPREGEWMFWDYQLKEISPYKYEEANRHFVKEGRVWFAKRNGQWYRITPNGEILFAESDEEFYKKQKNYLRQHKEREEEYGMFAIGEDDSYKGDGRKLIVRACDGKVIPHYYYTPYLAMSADDLKAHWKIGESFVNKYGQDMPNLHAFKMPKRTTPRYIFKLNKKIIELNHNDMMTLFVGITKQFGWSEQEIINMYVVMDSPVKKAVFCDWLLRKVKRNKDFIFKYSEVGDIIVAIENWIKRKNLK